MDAAAAVAAAPHAVFVITCWSTARGLSCWPSMVEDAQCPACFLAFTANTPVVMYACLHAMCTACHGRWRACPYRCDLSMVLHATATAAAPATNVAATASDAGAATASDVGAAPHGSEATNFENSSDDSSDIFMDSDDSSTSSGEDDY